VLKAIWNRKRRSEGGFTLIELVVVLAILGILIALAVPRYLGARRSALIAEGDNTLQELKTLAWAYYQQYGDWSGITDDATMATTFGFTPPGGSCFTFGTPGGAATEIAMTATTPGPASRAVCSALPAATIITLTLSNDGSSVRSQVIP
jgi:prepilin-type N-terminal cleavage/methylation domain-containing protein